MKKIIIALTMVLAFAGASFAADAATPADGGAPALEKKADKKAESKVKKAKKAKKAKAEAAAAAEKKAE